MLNPAILYRNTANYNMSVVASGTKTGLTSAAVLRATEDEYWLPDDINIDQTLTLDMGVAVSADGFALAGEKLNNVTIEVRGSTDNFSTSNVLISAASTGGSDNALYRLFKSTQYFRYWKVIISGLTSTSKVYHVLPVNVGQLPYLQDDPDVDGFKINSEVLQAQNGAYLGSVITSRMRNIKLNWGVVTEQEYAIFSIFAEECLLNSHPVWFIPDVSEQKCIFGWFDSKSSFSAPYDKGMRKLQTLSFNARVIV